MAELADAGDLKSPGLWPCGFESRPRHLRKPLRSYFVALLLGLVLGAILDHLIASNVHSPAVDFITYKVSFGIDELALSLVIVDLKFSISFNFSIMILLFGIVFLIVYHNL